MPGGGGERDGDSEGEGDGEGNGSEGEGEGEGLLVGGAESPWKPGGGGGEAPPWRSSGGGGLQPQLPVPGLAQGPQAWGLAALELLAARLEAIAIGMEVFETTGAAKQQAQWAGPPSSPCSITPAIKIGPSQGSQPRPPCPLQHTPQQCWCPLIGHHRSNRSLETSSCSHLGGEGGEGGEGDGGGGEGGLGGGDGLQHSSHSNYAHTLSHTV